MSTRAASKRRDWTPYAIVLACALALPTCLLAVSGLTVVLQPWLARSGLPVMEACAGLTVVRLRNQEVGVWWADRSVIIESPALLASRVAWCGLVPKPAWIDPEGSLTVFIHPPQH